MIKKFLLLAILFPLHLFSQPVIKHAEDFVLGEKLVFLSHTASSISPGASGANQTWDFTGVTSWEDSVVEDMVSPAATTHGKDFPTANAVEKYSDGSFIYANKTAGGSYLLGYVDTTAINGLEISYPNSMLFAVRPITYGNKLIDTFTTKGTVSGSAYTGSGTCTIEADGYGTLKLPNGTFNNVLRIKISQIQQDTGGGFPFAVKEISYTWFDSLHHSALLKIDSTSTGTSAAMTISYLALETTGVENDYPNSLSFKARINNDRLFLGGLNGNEKYNVELFNTAGQEVFTTQYTGASENAIDLLPLPAGAYIVRLKNSNSMGSMKVIKQ